MQLNNSYFNIGEFIYSVQYISCKVMSVNVPLYLWMSAIVNKLYCMFVQKLQFALQEWLKAEWTTVVQEYRDLKLIDVLFIITKYKIIDFTLFSLRLQVPPFRTNSFMEKIAWVCFERYTLHGRRKKNLEIIKCWLFEEKAK